MKRTILAALLAPLALFSAELQVKNLDFSEGLRHWRNAYPDIVKTELADGKLEITVLKESGTPGALVQYFPVTPRTNMVFSADVESGRDGFAFLNVKLNKERKEFASPVSRSANAGKQHLEIAFNTGDADQLAVLCRVNPLAGTSGESAKFSNLSLNIDNAARVFLAGDSTVENWNRPDDRAGWGQMLQELCTPGVKVVNLAVGGRSTKSFVDEKRWEGLLAQLSPGDVVLIQFGHNDQKKEQADRYAAAESDYQTYLKRFISEVKARQAEVILCTPVVRRIFDGDKIRNTLGAYPDAVRSVGTETGIPVIDLNRATAALLETYGPEKSAELFYVSSDGVPDRSHFNRAGAKLVAEEVAREMKTRQLPGGKFVK